MNSMKEVQEAVNKVLNKKPPKKKKQSEIFETQKPKKLKSKPKEKKSMKMPKPVGKPRKELTKGQKELMKEHKEHHTAKHMTIMKKLMKKGY